MINLLKEPKILADTVTNENYGTRATTFIVTIPTCIVAELRTHKIISQVADVACEVTKDNLTNISANSDRAIPVSRKIKAVLDNPYIPRFTGTKPGMQGRYDLSEDQIKEATYLHLLPLTEWENSDLHKMVKGFQDLDIHKQVINRHLMPWAWSTVILTATEWTNFFELRCPQYKYESVIYKSKKELLSIHPELNDKPQSFFDEINLSGTEPTFMYIAELMYDLYKESQPKTSAHHIPFLENIISNYESDIVEFLEKYKVETGISKNNDLEDWKVFIYKCISTSLCAKISYDTHEKDDTLEKHISRAALLYDHRHLEPFSHSGTIMTEEMFKSFKKVEMTFDRNNNPEEVVEYGWCHTVRGMMPTRYLLEASTNLNNKFLTLKSLTHVK